jgi:tetratricopeptide (TPR) repeat protein
MNRLFIIILLAVSATARAQTPEDFFRRGNELFQAGDYEGAAEAYSGAVAMGVESGELWFNLGNSQYKSGKIAQAILSYERAALFMPDDEDLRHNLRLANMLITDRIEPAPRLFVWDLWDDVRAAFSIAGITWLAYGFLLLTAAAAVSFLLARTYRRRKWSLAAGAAAGALFLFALVVFLGKRADLTERRDAILLADVATAKNSPDAASTDAFVLHAGVKVRILERVNGWDKVRLADGKVGWLEAGAAEPI